MKILVLTSQYPGPDIPKTLTSVVHYFTKEWIQNGHEVKVVYNLTVFPKWMYFLFRLFRHRLENKAGYMFVKKVLPELDYEWDGVKVYRRNINKIYPHRTFSDNAYKNQVLKICKILSNDNFRPDIIVGHWWTPQLRLIKELGDLYHCKTVLVTHGVNPDICKEYGASWKMYVDDLCMIGYRSKQIYKKCCERYKLGEKPHFFCYSGIPFTYENMPQKVIGEKKRIYTFVGTFIERKYPQALIYVLKDYKVYDCCINYIGTGPMKHHIQKMVNDYGMCEKVKFWGQVPREQVSQILSESDIFVMISKDETFGLVYLEAMAHGCITIGSRNEGIDGIIIDGVNGFLCEAGNTEELREILAKIDSMDKRMLSKISQSAQLTAHKYTEKQVAIDYLKNLEKCI